MDNKTKITNAIKKNVVPEIKSLGFTGSFPYFKKNEGDSIYFIGFQFGKTHLVGKMVVELGFADKNKLPDWAKSEPEEKLNYGISQRSHRLGQKSEKEDGVWYDYDSLKTEEDFENLSLSILETLKKELPKFIESI